MADQTASRDAWLSAVDKVLKGAAFDSLIAHSRDGIAIEPLYPPAEGRAPRAGRDGARPVAVVQRIDHPDPREANRLAREDLAGGADGLTLVLAGSAGGYGFGVRAAAAEDFAAIFDGIALDRIMLRIEGLPSAAEGTTAALFEGIARHGPAPALLDLGFDAADGQAPSALTPWQLFAEKGSRPQPARRLMRADGRPHHAAGASEAQELAAVLATGVACLRASEPNGLEAARASLSFALAADADEFLTIAKFRALRRLWSSVEQACGLDPRPIGLHAETAWRMLARQDAHTNLPRNTVAAAAAILGGADSVTVLPHTSAHGLPDADARRLARNIVTVLREESGLGRVVDPAAGAGGFEALTDALCATAWALFQDIERNGGLEAVTRAGTWQKTCAATREARQADLAAGKKTLVGVTAFITLADAPPPVLIAAPAAKSMKERDAAPFEARP